MATVSGVVLAAMAGTPLLQEARSYYFMTASDIAALKTQIDNELANFGYRVGPIGPFVYQEQFTSAVESWNAVANVSSTLATSLPTQGILVAAVTSDPFSGPVDPFGLVVSLGGGRQLLLMNTINTDATSFAFGTTGYSTLLHEIGHALGLNHSFAEGAKPAVPIGTDSEKYTVMSETTYTHRPVMPQLYDIGVIQDASMYGLNTTTRAAGDSVYRFLPTPGAPVTNLANGQEFRPLVGSMKWPMISIWDAGSNTGDTIDASALATNSKINLNQGEFSNIGGVDNVSVAYGAQIENAIGESADDTLVGNDIANVLEGNGGRDTLLGGPGADTLYGERVSGQPLSGAAGNDKLDGGVSLAALQPGSTTPGQGDGANDTLEGGAEFDTYIVRQGGGVDVLRDSGDNRITFRREDDTDIQVPLTNLYRDSPGANQGKNTDGTVAWSLVSGSLTLTYTVPNSDPAIQIQTVIENFQEGSFGINIRDSQAAHTYTAPGPAIVGDDNQNSLTGTLGADLIQALGGNDTVTAGAEDDIIEAGDGGDFAYGEAGFDRLYGGAGLDQLYGGDDNDEVFGGADADILEGGAGYDKLAGESGRDIVVGDAGDDEVYAADQITLDLLDDAITAGETQVGSGFIGEWLDGGEGEDILVAMQDNDLLAGGGGADVLIGSGGDDNLLGDHERNWVFINWSLTRTVQTEGNTTTYGLVLTDADASVVATGTGDELYGGAGVDWLFGGLGGDYLDGGADDDVLFGQEGFDVLFGGTGNDVLSGEDANVPVAEIGDDYLDGEDGADRIFGGGGADELFGGSGNDELYGDDASLDPLYQGADYLDGEEGDDYLQGLGGDDEIFGGAGLDTLVGNAGNDYLDKLIDLLILGRHGKMSRNAELIHRGRNDSRPRSQSARVDMSRAAGRKEQLTTGGHLMSEKLNYSTKHPLFPRAT